MKKFKSAIPDGQCDCPSKLGCVNTEIQANGRYFVSFGDT